MVIPPGCIVKKGTVIIAGQSGGPIPEGGIITVDSDIKNNSSEGDLIFEYQYQYED